jgi:hypothetical protein
MKGVPIGWLWPCPQILRPDWKGFSKDEPSSLLGLPVSDKGKKFYNIDQPGGQGGLQEGRLHYRDGP